MFKEKKHIKEIVDKTRHIQRKKNIKGYIHEEGHMEYIMIFKLN